MDTVSVTRSRSQQITASAVGKRSFVTSSGRSSTTVTRKPTVVSRGHRAREQWPPPNRMARSPMGRGRAMWALSVSGASCSAGAPPSSASTSAPGCRRAMRCSTLPASSFHTGSPAAMNCRCTVTSPPHTMPMSSPSLWRSLYSWTALRRSRSSVCPSAMAPPSTAPPPMVPDSSPASPTSICAPLPRGVEPLSAMMVHSTVSWCFSIS